MWNDTDSGVSVIVNYEMLVAQWNNASETKNMDLLLSSRSLSVALSALEHKLAFPPAM